MADVDVVGNRQQLSKPNVNVARQRHRWSCHLCLWRNKIFFSKRKKLGKRGTADTHTFIIWKATSRRVNITHMFESQIRGISSSFFRASMANITGFSEKRRRNNVPRVLCYNSRRSSSSRQRSDIILTVRSTCTVRSALVLLCRWVVVVVLFFFFFLARHCWTWPFGRLISSWAFQIFAFLGDGQLTAADSIDAQSFASSTWPVPCSFSSPPPFFAGKLKQLSLSSFTTDLHWNL